MTKVIQGHKIHVHELLYRLRTPLD